jgi:hypothetical protein
MRLLPEHYLQAATERIDQAEANFDRRYHALAMNTAARAVECILRAHFFQKHGVGAALESAHNIPELFKASGLKVASLEARRKRGDSDTDITRYSRELEADVADIFLRWSNDYRYASEDRLRAYLKRQNLHRMVRGDFVRGNAGKLNEAARRVVNEGVERWSRSKKK